MPLGQLPVAIDVTGSLGYHSVIQLPPGKADVSCGVLAYVPHVPPARDSHAVPRLQGLHSQKLLQRRKLIVVVEGVEGPIVRC